MYLDGVLKTNHVFPAASGDVNTNVTDAITVSAGAHTIVVTNAGLDWIKLGNITLNPYTFLLGAYAVGNTNFTAMWIWHRTNVFRASPGPSVIGTVTVSGLTNGTYAATWWDTFGAGVISNFTFTVPSPGASVTLTTPPVSRSLALYAGFPASAAVLPPDLSQSVPSNSAPFNLPLAITNSGGLPLAYSLSFTSPIPSWLTFSSTNGYVSKSGMVTVYLAINPAGLAPGTYTFTIFVNTSDSLLPVTVFPISLTITSTTLPAAPQLLFVSASGGQFVFQLLGDDGVPYVVETSPDLVGWTAVSTNILSGGALSITNDISPGVDEAFWRALWQP
jgi:hypothetical protein